MNFRKPAQLLIPPCTPLPWISRSSDNAIAPQSSQPPPLLQYLGAEKDPPPLKTLLASTAAAVPIHRNPIQQVSMATCVKIVHITHRTQGPLQHKHLLHLHLHHYPPLVWEKLRQTSFPPLPHLSPAYTPETGVGEAKLVSYALYQTRV